MGAPQEPAEPTEQPPEPQQDRRPAAHPALAVLAVAGLGFAALELRPASGLFSAGSAPLTGAFGLVLLLILGWLIALERVNRRYRAAVLEARELPPRAERLVEAARRLLPGAAIGVPVLLLACYLMQNRPTGGGAYRGDLRPDPYASVLAPSPSSTPLTGHPPHVPGHHLGLSHLIGLVLQVGLLLMGLTAAFLVWRQLRGRPRRSAAPQPVPRAGVEERLAEAVELGRRALLGSDARAAVIACYAAMEESLAASGVTRRAADSPTELLERAVAAGTVRGADATALTALFREARYSRHPMGEAQLSRARAALDAIAAYLDQHRPQSEEATV